MVDWDCIKTEYIAKGLSLEELSQKYKVKRATIGTRCAREKWQAEREKHQKKRVDTTLAVRERIGREQDKHIKETDALIATGAEMLIKSIIGGIKKYGDEMPANVGRDYGVALKNAMQVRDQVYGIMTPLDKAHIDEMLADTKIKLAEHEARMKAGDISNEPIEITFGNKESEEYSK